MSPVSLVVLISPSCTHCERFLQYWEKEQSNWENVTMREVSIVTPEGQELAREKFVFASPGIIMNGELCFSGGYDEKEFLATLKAFSIAS